MLTAFGLGALAQSSLLIAGVTVYWVKVPRRLVGVLAGFGAGAMLAAISFDLVAEADDLAFWTFGLWMLLGVGVFLGAVLVSNVPQAVAPSADLAAAGWTARRLGHVWLVVVLACGVAAAVGYLAADVSGAVTGEGMAAFAAGGLLAMLTNSLIPFAHERGGELAGVGTVVGFCLALMSS